MSELPACRECGHRNHWLGTHIVELHGMSVDDYLYRHPGAPLVSKSALADLNKGNGNRVVRAHPPSPDMLTTVFAKTTIRVHADVPPDACLPLPEAFRVPVYGDLAEDVCDVMIPLVMGRSIYVWGPQGTGKDALFHAYSAYARRPALIFQIEPSTDIRAWFFSHEFDKEGTDWPEGELMRAIRNGYTTPTGRVIPYMILLTDFDRATKEQAEALRLVLDSIEGRVKGPKGVTYQVLKGTQFVMTANTAGAGDESGRYVSANVMDSSILDRIERAYMFHPMHWLDEEVIVRAKFPILVERCPDVFKRVGDAVDKLRAAIRSHDLYTEFSHRAVCAWLGAAADIVTIRNSVPGDLLRRAFRVVQDKMPDAETRMKAGRIVSAHIDVRK